MFALGSFRRSINVSEAETYYKRSIQEWSDIEGTDGVQTLNTMASLAMLYSSMDQYEEAEQVLLKVLERRKKHTRAPSEYLLDLVLVNLHIDIGKYSRESFCFGLWKNT